jgi:hypothetical protein
LAEVTVSPPLDGGIERQGRGGSRWSRQCARLGQGPAAGRTPLEKPNKRLPEQASIQDYNFCLWDGHKLVIFAAERATRRPSAPGCLPVAARPATICANPVFPISGQAWRRSAISAIPLGIRMIQTYLSTQVYLFINYFIIISKITFLQIKFLTNF